MVRAVVLLELPGSARLTDELPGFVSKYATSALEEDKAETFAFLMAAPARLQAIAARDAVIRAKIAAVKAELLRVLSGDRSTLLGAWRIDLS